MLVLMCGTLLFGIFLYAAYQFFRFNSKATWITFIALPILLLPWWIHHYHHTWFGWAKIYSVALGVIVIQFCRSPHFQNKKIYFLAAYLVLFLNIAEAVVNDFLASGLAHQLNAMAGILLIATMTTTRSMSVEQKIWGNDFSWKLPLSWILGYTFWNINFVYMNFTELTAAHFAVLGSALIVGLYHPQQWLQARALILGIYLIIHFSDKNFLKPIYTEEIFHQNIALAISFFSVAWMLFCLSQKIWKTRHRPLMLHPR